MKAVGFIVLSFVSFLASAPASGQCAEGKLLASDAGAGGGFGSAALEGDLALVGGLERAYVLERSPGGWVETAVLTTTDGTPGQGFGASVSISGVTALVGAPEDATLALASGAAYVFELLPGGWTQIAILRPGDPKTPQFFGSSVAVDGNRALVGARLSDSSGAAYFFERDDMGTPSDPSDDTWAEVAKFKVGLLDDYFGERVALQGETALVSAPGYDNFPIGVSGAVYAFAHTPTGWVGTQTIEPLSTTDVKLLVGVSLSLHDDRFLTGSANGASSVSGAEFLFERDAGDPLTPLDDTWVQVAMFEAANPYTDAFGGVSSLWDDTFVVGAPEAVFVYEEVGSGWIQTARLVNCDGITGDGFGAAVALQADRILVSAPLTGMLHLFRFEAQQSLSVPRFGPPNPQGFTQVEPPVLNTDWVTRVDLAAAGPGFVGSLIAISAIGPTLTFTASGNLLILPPFLALDVGSGEHAIPIPNRCALIGLGLWTQAVAYSPAAFQLYNALDITLGTF